MGSAIWCILQLDRRAFATVAFLYIVCLPICGLAGPRLFYQAMYEQDALLLHGCTELDCFRSVVAFILLPAALLLAILGPARTLSIPVVGRCIAQALLGKAAPAHEEERILYRSR